MSVSSVATTSALEGPVPARFVAAARSLFSPSERTAVALKAPLEFAGAGSPTGFPLTKMTTSVFFSAVPDTDMEDRLKTSPERGCDYLRSVGRIQCHDHRVFQSR